MTVKIELLRCTKEGSNALFLLNYFKESEDLQEVHPLCVGNTRGLESLPDTGL